MIPKNVDDREGLVNEAKFFKIQGLIDLIEGRSLQSSNIIDKKQTKELTKLCEFFDQPKWNLLYRASFDGFGAKDFHLKCDGVKDTLTIIKTTQSYIFGGFTNIAWDSSNKSKIDHNAFIFSLVNKENKPIKIKFDSINGRYSIGCYSSFVITED